jgi:hypothetical protein
VYTLVLKYEIRNLILRDEIGLYSLVDNLSYSIIVTIAGSGSTEVQVGSLRDACQNIVPQHQVRQTDEVETSNIMEVQDVCKLTLNPRSTVLIEKLDKSTNYQCRFEDNR